MRGNRADIRETIRCFCVPDGSETGSGRSLYEAYSKPIRSLV
nr:MAG TPA: hypothetical protein [Caudoviricetes sp.]